MNNEYIILSLIIISLLTYGCTPHESIYKEPSENEIKQCYDKFNQFTCPTLEGINYLFNSEKCNLSQNNYNKTILVNGTNVKISGLYSSNCAVSTLKGCVENNNNELTFILIPEPQCDGNFAACICIKKYSYELNISSPGEYILKLGSFKLPIIIPSTQDYTFESNQSNAIMTFSDREYENAQHMVLNDSNKAISMCKKIDDTYSQSECLNSLAFNVLNSSEELAIEICNTYGSYDCFRQLAYFVAKNTQDLDKVSQMCRRYATKNGIVGNNDKYTECILPLISILSENNRSEEALKICKDLCPKDSYCYYNPNGGCYSYVVRGVKKVDMAKAKEICEKAPRCYDSELRV